MQTLDELLNHRETQNLKYMSWTRIVLSLFGILSNLTANSAFYGDLYLKLSMFLVIWGVVILVNTGFLWFLRKSMYLGSIGFIGVILDTFALWIIPEIWYQLAGSDQVGLSFFMKFPFTIYCFITLAISCLAMKPQYPAIIMVGVLLNHLYYFFLVNGDPTIQFSNDVAGVYFGSSVSIDIYMANIITFLLTSGTLIFFTHLVRKIVYEAAELEHETTVIREQQARMLIQGKMESLKGLVAGFTHEINTPIGVIQSGLDVTERCAQKVTEVVDTSESLEAVKTSNPLQKSLKLLTVSTANSRTAGDRISTIVSSLKNFTRLDEAEFQTVDLHEGLDSTLILMEHELQDRITVVKNYGDLPDIGCNPTEINQVFNNVLTNAIQAIEGEGTIRIHTNVEDNQAIIKISDTGIGMSSDQLQHLFEPTFSQKGPRVKAGLGLFSAYQIIHKHQGELRLDSQKGEGTTVEIQLPYGLKRQQLESDGILDQEG